MKKAKTPRRTYKLPRKIVKWMRGTPCPGNGWAWAMHYEEAAKAAAKASRRSDLWGTWCDTGRPYWGTNEHMWLVLDAPEKPEINKWGEVSP